MGPRSRLGEGPEGSVGGFAPRSRKLYGRGMRRSSVGLGREVPAGTRGPAGGWAVCSPGLCRSLPVHLSVPWVKLSL